MAMTDDQVRMLLEGLLGGMGRGGGGGGERTNVKRTLDDRMFMRMSKFAGVEKEWKEWDFNFKIIVKGASNNFTRMFEVLEGTKLGEAWEETIKAKIAGVAGVLAS